MEVIAPKVTVTFEKFPNVIVSFKTYPTSTLKKKISELLSSNKFNPFKKKYITLRLHRNH